MTIEYNEGAEHLDSPLLMLREYIRRIDAGEVDPSHMVIITLEYEGGNYHHHSAVTSKTGDMQCLGMIELAKNLVLHKNSVKPDDEEEDWKS